MKINVELLTVENGRPTRILLFDEQYLLTPKICEPPFEITVETTPIKVRRKYRKRIQKDSFGVSKKYKTQISNEEVKNVMKVINKVELNFLPTSNEIQKATNMPMRRVNATIDLLISKGIVSKRKEGRTVIYRDVSTSPLFPLQV